MRAGAFEDDGSKKKTMETMANRASSFRETLLRWYDEKQRELPWRRRKEETTTPTTPTEMSEEEEDRYAYGVWVSEIMSQQTQIERAAEYWCRWVEKWPTVKHLADATEDEVRDMWAGLGYYRRSQFLLKGAKYVNEELDGKFPRDIVGLMKIPGIGPYTASAVGSIAFGIREAAIDGNVNRVLTRVERIRGDPVKEKKTVDSIKRVAKELIGKSDDSENDDDDDDDGARRGRPGDFNQAMMELGATVCKPKNPSCNECPISHFCKGYQQELISDGQNPVTAYPEIAKKAEKRQEAIAVAVVSCTVDNTKWFFLTKRPENGLLAGMWEFPSVFMREGELATESVPSASDVYDAQKFFRESDTRGVSELFASIASTSNARENKEVKIENDGRKKEEDVSFKHEPGVVTHVFSHVKHHMHVFSLDLGTLDALPRRVKKEDSEENVVAPGNEKEDKSKSEMIHSSSSSSSSWFCSSDFEDKGVFSTGVQKVYAFAEKRGAHETSGNIRKRNAAATKSTKYDGNEDVNIHANAVVTTIDDDGEKKKIAKNNNAKKKKKEKDKKEVWNYKTKDIASFFFSS